MIFVIHVIFVRRKVFPFNVMSEITGANKYLYIENRILQK